MKVLVTGAGGFVGGHVARHFAGLGHTVTGVVHRSRPAGLDGVAGLQIVQTDLAGAGPLPLSGATEAVVHCASALPSNVRDEAELLRINVEGSRRVFAYAREAGARTVIYCSSMAAFGTIDADVVDVDTPVVAPGAYGRSKLEGEVMLAEAAGAAPLRAVSIRLPGVVGRGSHDNFLSNVMAAILKDQPVKGRNPDAPFNNIVHVSDLAGFFADLLTALPEGHRMTTIAADAPITIGKAISLLYATAGRPERVTYDSGGRPFTISPEPARALGYRVPDTADRVRRLARDCAIS
jgi:nucleoside-diphosphate-sugar epimerase